jgi:hypothetical protein
MKRKKIIKAIVKSINDYDTKYLENRTDAEIGYTKALNDILYLLNLKK